MSVSRFVSPCPGGFFRSNGDQIAGDDGRLVIRRGIGPAGWRDFENWMTGFPAYQQRTRGADKMIRPFRFGHCGPRGALVDLLPHACAGPTPV